MNMKRLVLVIVPFAIAVGAYFAWSSDQPFYKEPDPRFEAAITAPDVAREHFFIQSQGFDLEADLVMPVGGAEQKPAVIFSPGSSDMRYQDYHGEMLQKYLLDSFLPRDCAVLFVNKRGMGESQGTWLNNGIEGRAEDLHAAVDYLEAHPLIDGEHIGLVGHSQGGWVVNLVASQDPQIDFFISLAGPTTSVLGNMEDNYRGGYGCDGYEGQELEDKVASQLKMTRFGSLIGKVFPFGVIGLDAMNIDYDPYEALTQVDMPGLFVYAEKDMLVSPARNLERFNEVFEGNPPENLRAEVIPGANHIYRLVDTVCYSIVASEDLDMSEDLVTLIEAWLTENGF